MLEYIRLDNPNTLEEQRRCILAEGLISSQDYISMLDWNYKRNAIPIGQISLVNSSKENTCLDHPLLLGFSLGEKAMFILKSLWTRDSS